jgi:ABC-2 type transport system permease protein
VPPPGVWCAPFGATGTGYSDIMTDYPAPRRIGAVNWLGLWTLYLKEVQRFIAVKTQAIIAPVVTTLLFLAVFSLALGRAVEMVNGVPFARFLAPGLVMMAMVQNAFANTSSSLVVSKVQGNIVDILMPPLSPAELTVGIALGGTTRGLVVGTATLAGMRVFVEFGIHDAFFVLFHAFAASLMLSLLGMIGGIWADKFDHMAAVTNFVITPFAFLSGTFYSIQRLPGFFQTLAHLNPFFYMIDGFRYGFTGVTDTAPMLGVAVMLAIDTVLALVCWRLFATGYKLKA